MSMPAASGWIVERRLDDVRRVLVPGMLNLLIEEAREQGWRVRSLSQAGSLEGHPRASPISSAQATPGPCFFTGSPRHQKANGRSPRGGATIAALGVSGPAGSAAPAEPDGLFWMSRSSWTIRSSLRSRASSSRSAVVSPVLPCVRLACACLIQLPSDEGVKSRSRAMAPIVLPSSNTSRTAAAINSSVNCRRARRPVFLDPILDIVSAFRKVSTKPDQAHRGRSSLSDRPDSAQLPSCSGCSRSCLRCRRSSQRGMAPSA